MSFQSRLRWFINKALSIVAYLLSLLLCVGFCFAFLISDRVARRPVKASDKLSFFVICSERPGIVVSEELEKYLEKSTCGFSIPNNQVEYWNQELAKTVKADSVVSWKLAVKQLTEKKQEVNLLFSNDDYYVFSWYEVEGRNVTPTYIKIIHIGHGFFAFILGCIVWLIGWWAVRKLYRKFRA